MRCNRSLSTPGRCGSTGLLGRVNAKPPIDRSRRDTGPTRCVISYYRQQAQQAMPGAWDVLPGVELIPRRRLEAATRVSNPSAGSKSPI